MCVYMCVCNFIAGASCVFRWRGVPRHRREDVLGAAGHGRRGGVGVRHHPAIHGCVYVHVYAMRTYSAVQYGTRMDGHSVQPTVVYSTTFTHAGRTTTEAEVDRAAEVLTSYLVKQGLVPKRSLFGK